jgi:hypothetical protein
MSMWNADELLQIAHDALAAHAAHLDEEQSVQGLDSLGEIQLHLVLAAGFAQAGYAVVREAPYPGEPQKRPPARERERCDLVILPRGVVSLVDPVEALKKAEREQGTLFEHVEHEQAAQGATPEEAYWLEVKTIGQFTPRQGVPVPNTSWSSELGGALRVDLRKLGRDPRLSRGALLLVLFTQGRDVAEHDLGVALNRALDRGVEFREPRTAAFPIPDRIGNDCCTLALIERPAGL